jgi:hypothetical protein
MFAKFTVATRVTTSSNETAPVYINPFHVVSMTEAGDGHTRLVMSGGHEQVLSDPLETVLARFAEAGSRRLPGA